MKFNSIAIVGLGLMGGSLAAACRRKYPASRVIGVSRSRQALAGALKKRWIHEGSTNLAHGVESADLIILCTPVDTLARLISEIDQSAKPDAILTDVGSVKAPLQKWAGRRVLKNVRFVGAHPMAGSHERGLAAAHPGLYDSALTFLIKEKKTDAKAFRAVKTFWKRIGKRTVTLKADAHDRIVAEMSHLPHAVATSLINSCAPRSLPYAASGFRDVTRIAQGDPSIWIPIFFSNSHHIKRSIQSFRKVLQGFERRLDARDASGMKKFLEKAALLRRKI